jgi:hypothetical protein
VLNILVQGAHAPLMQHLAPVIIERVNRFFGYSAVAKLAFRQGAPVARAEKAEAPEASPVPKELGPAFAKSPIRSSRVPGSPCGASRRAMDRRRSIPSGADPIPISGVKR